MTDERRGLGYLIGPITFALLILIGLLAIHATEPPSVVPENGPITEFSAARAMRDVREIAKKPHPLGSPENDQVLKYLVGRLHELGANTEVQTAIVSRHSPFGPDTWAVVNNLIANVPGTQSVGAVLIVAHYDSVPSGPGAGDDVASVAAILETIRALKAGPALRNDLIVLFTDGEELGSLGAEGFVEKYRSLRDIKVVVLNFDMRGDQGPSMMFQTSPRNSWLIDQLAAAAPFPYATSAAPAVYKRLPNDTDLTVFLDAGMAGMNFAAAGGLTRYHTALDNAEMLDERTLQHQGSYALTMARRLGSIDLNVPRTGEAVFFVVAGKLIHYSARLASPLAILVTLLVVGIIWVGILEGRFSIIGVATGSAIYAIAIVVLVIEARGVWWMIATLVGWRMLPVGTTYGGLYYSVATIALIFATLWIAYELIGRSIRLQNLDAGALMVWTVLMLATSIAMPGGSYIFAWPLLFAAIGMSVRPSSDKGVTVRAAMPALIALAPAVAVLAPSFAASADGTVLFLEFCGLTAALLFGLLIPYMDFLTGGQKWIVPAVLGLLAIVMFVTGTVASGFNASHPHPDSIFYFMDADRRRARWVSLDQRPDSFTAQFFQHHVHAGWLPKLVGLATRDTPDRNLANISRDFAYLNRGRTTEGNAPQIRAAPPELKVLDDSTIAAGVRTVKMHIASARNASIIWMSVPVGVTVLGASIDGNSPGDRTTDGWTGWYWRAPAAGFDLTLRVATPGPFVITIIDQTEGLPSTPGFEIKPRPAGTMPTPFLFFDSTTLVRKTFAIGGEQVTTR